MERKGEHHPDQEQYKDLNATKNEEKESGDILYCSM